MMNDLLVKIGIRSFEVTIIKDNEIEINENTYKTQLKQINKNQYRLKLNERQYQIYVDDQNYGKYITHLNGENNDISILTKLEEEAKKLVNNKSIDSKENKILSPMNGLVVNVNKKVGDKVKVGESLLVLEAMKMENEIKSTLEGIIIAVKCYEGKSIERGELLFIIN